MISSLRDAWKWYEQVRALAGHMQRLGERFWDRDEWAQALGHDNRFRHVESSALGEGARTILSDLDDLAVLLMFSVFEAIVRNRALDDVIGSLPDQLHPVVEDAIDELKTDLENGSFGRMTDKFKSLKSLDHVLIEKVSQVRKYRNWVAHGRRGQKPPMVTPDVARERLSEFLERMGESGTTQATGRAGEGATT